MVTLYISEGWAVSLTEAPAEGSPEGSGHYLQNVKKQLDVQGFSELCPGKDLNGVRDRLLRGARAALLEGVRHADQRNQISGTCRIRFPELGEEFETASHA